MLPVHDHTARASTKNIAAMGPMFMDSREASASGPVGSPAIANTANTADKALPGLLPGRLPLFAA